MIYKQCLTAIALSFTLMAHANDSTYAYDNNGITYVPEERITLEKEVLFLSQDEIKVDYVFRNLTNEDVEIDLAFPVATCFTCYDGDVSLPARPDVMAPIASFSTSVNGAKIKSNMTLRAVMGGLDVTQKLEALGVKIQSEPYDWMWEGKDTGFGKEAEAQLRKAKLFDEENIPLWDVEEVYTWKTIFKANSQTSVSHRYEPSISFDFVTEYTNFGDDFPNVCAETGFLKSAKEIEMGSARELKYLLGPGRNWAGPIGELKVIVDKGDPSSLVSFCGDGVTKTSPTSFEFTRKDYEPKEGEVTSVLFVKKP